MLKPYDMNSLEGKAYKITIEEVTKLNLGTLGARTRPILSTVLSFCWEKRTTKIV